MDKKNALIIFAKTPSPHFVKTRLISSLTAEDAATFYSSCLTDITNTMHTGPRFETWMCIAPERFDSKLFPADLNIFPHFFQTGQNLGERMYNAFQYLFDLAFQKVAIIGSDFPCISVDLVEDAFTKLENTDGVIGPTEDGGYYLIALKKNYDVLFKDIEWSTEKVYMQTKAQAETHGIKLGDLDMHYDVDTITEIKRLYSDLHEMDSKKQNFPHHVWHFMQNKLNSFL